MKKISTILAAFIVIAMVAGCAGNSAAPDSPGNQIPDPPEIPEISDGAPLPEDQPVMESDPAGLLPESVMVADSAMYRGTITDIGEDDDGLIMTVEQVRGTNFGYPSLVIAVGNDIVMSGFQSPDELQVGDYLEVFYGLALSGEGAVAIAARLLPGADLVIFNGAIEEVVVQEAQLRVGYIRLSAIDGGSEHVFHFSPEFTQFYLDFDVLQPGDKLNIFYNGVSTRSIPPQSSALEVRYYAE